MVTTKTAKKTPTVPETLKLRAIRKKKQTRVARQAKRKAVLKGAEKKKLYFSLAEKYAKEYKQKEKDDIIKARQARKHNNFYVPQAAKVAFVIRIRGINGIAPKPRKVLQLLRLRQINNGVFIKLNKATVNMLRLAEPYIAWGYPNLSIAKKLLYKRGFAKVEGRRLPLSNEIIERKLKKLICVEDVIHELLTCGPLFQKASNMLWPFKLSSPNGGWRKKGRHYADGGDFGNREEKINVLLKKMI
jgi:60S ribosomal protein uL30